MSAAKLTAAKLTLGPVLFNWSADTLRDFWFRMADEAPLDTVCLGEVVCAKRAPFSTPVLAQVIERLQAAGKEVVVSTLGLVMDHKDRELVEAMTGFDDLLVEANDVTAVAQLGGRPFAVGPLVNLYNEGTLAMLEGMGAVRACLPVELPLPSIAAIAGTAKAEIEVQAYGRMPLALSARCYHARAHGLAKDGCQYVCGQDADGLPVDTLDGRPFLTVNGTQTMSVAYQALTRELADLTAAGVSRFRLWPQDVDMVLVARTYRDLLDGRLDATEALATLDELSGVDLANGYIHGQEGHRMVG